MEIKIEIRSVGGKCTWTRKDSSEIENENENGD